MLPEISSLKIQPYAEVNSNLPEFKKRKDHYGVITRINTRRATVKLDDGTNPLIPYHMLKESDEPPRLVLPGYEEPKNIKDEIQIGDWVRVNWKGGDIRVGTIKKKNPSKAIILMEDGKNWNVRYQAILGKVSNESRKDKFKVGDRVSYVMDWRGLGVFEA